MVETRGMVSVECSGGMVEIVESDGSHPLSSVSSLRVLCAQRSV